MNLYHATAIVSRPEKSSDVYRESIIAVAPDEAMLWQMYMETPMPYELREQWGGIDLVIEVSDQREIRDLTTPVMKVEPVEMGVVKVERI
ncbi:hypothetical protein ACFL0V_05305 [Nanoarchaeota archaeon]